MSAIPAKARKAVRERDGGICQRCGMNGPDIHHRLRRRDGGHKLSILVTMCRDCHSWVHNHPLSAKLTGYIIGPWPETDTATVLLKTYGGWVRFDDAGSKAYADHHP